MVGPDFHAPSSPVIKAYTRTPLPVKTVKSAGASKANKSQKFIMTQDLPAEWWMLFHSPAINELVRTGMQNSPTIQAAMAALANSRELLKAQIGNSLLPAFNALGSYERQQYSSSSFGNIPFDVNRPFSLYTSAVNVSYNLDVFGGARRQIESLGAQVDYQQFELLAALLTLTSNITNTAITIASYQAQIDATHQLINSQQGLLTILEKQFNLGGVSKESVLIQKTLVEQTRASLPPLQKNLAQSKDALSVLIGQLPNTPLPTIKLKDLTLPTQLPLTLPSTLIRQRPDVRAAEALLHSANAQIGVATANLFPTFTINGSYGWAGLALSNLYENQNKVWNILGQATQPIFHGGALFADRRAAIDQFKQSWAQYRQTVLQGFQNVADTLYAIETDARTLQAQKRAEDAALGSLKLTRDQFRLGAVSYLNLLNTQQQYQQTLIARIQAQALRYSDTVALFQALGGGWWNTPNLGEFCLKKINPAYRSVS